MVLGVRGAIKKKQLNNAVNNFAGRSAAAEAAGAEVTERALRQAAKAERNAKESLAKMTAYKGGLWDNMKSAGTRLVDVFRGTGHTTVEAVTEKAAKITSKQRAGFIERFASTPFALAAKHPKKTVVGLGLLAVVGISSLVHRSAEKRTQRQAMAEMEQAAAIAQAQQANTVSYQNQVTPAEYEALQARMKGAEGPKAGHADAVAAARQQGAPAAAASL